MRAEEVWRTGCKGEISKVISVIGVFGGGGGGWMEVLRDAGPSEGGLSLFFNGR